MKPEPLKDKTQCCEGVNISECDRQEQFYYLDEDVKAAVEWLKEQVKIKCYVNKHVYDKLIEIIEEAFPDLK